MNDWTLFSLIWVLALLAIFNLEWVATLLNLRAFPVSVPPLLVGVTDEAAMERARDYLSVNSRFSLVESGISLFGLLLFWVVGGFPWLDGWARSLGGSDLTVGLLFLSAVFVGQTLFSLPFVIYHTFGIEERFGFNRSTLKTFVADQLKGFLLAAVLGLPLAAAVLWIFYHVPNAWLWAWLAFTAFQIGLMWLAPTWILPLFNRFTPMPDGPLNRSICELGKRCGFPLEGVFVMDGSKRSTKANAFFTGFGKHKKIALFDTLIEKSSEDELLGVLAHEIGHFRCGHIRQRLAVSTVRTGLTFFLLGWCIDPASSFARVLFDSFAVREISPFVGMVLFSLALEPLSRLLAVLSHAWSRRQEFEADAYAAAVTGDSAPLMRALKRLHGDHLSHPSPARLRVWLDYSHPPLMERLEKLSTRGSDVGVSKSGPCP